MGGKWVSGGYVNYELRVTNYELGKAYVLWICGIRNVKFNIEKYLREASIASPPTARRHVQLGLV